MCHDSPPPPPLLRLCLFYLDINLSLDGTSLRNVLLWSNRPSDGSCVCVAGTLKQICVTECCARQRTRVVGNLLADSLNPLAEWTITWRNPYSPGVSSSGRQTQSVTVPVLEYGDRKPLLTFECTYFCEERMMMLLVMWGFRFHSYHCDIHMFSLCNLYIPALFHIGTYLQQLRLHGCDFSFKFSGILVNLRLKEQIYKSILF